MHDTWEEDGDAPLSRTERKLVELSTALVDDVFLSGLINRAHDGAGTPLVVLTNGMIVAGTLTSPRDMAGHLDSENARHFDWAEKPDDMTDEDWEVARKRAHDGYKDDWDGYRENEDKFLEALPDDDDSPLPAEDGERLIHYQRKAFLTLKNARIHAPGVGGGSRVAVLRIPARAVNVWWVPETHILDDGTTRAEIKIWGSVDDDPDSGSD